MKYFYCLCAFDMACTPVVYACGPHYSKKMNYVPSPNHHIFHWSAHTYASYCSEGSLSMSPYSNSAIFNDTLVFGEPVHIYGHQRIDILILFPSYYVGTKNKSGYSVLFSATFHTAQMMKHNNASGITSSCSWHKEAIGLMQ